MEGRADLLWDMTRFVLNRCVKIDSRGQASVSFMPEIAGVGCQVNQWRASSRFLAALKGRQKAQILLQWGCTLSVSLIRSFQVAWTCTFEQLSPYYHCEDFDDVVHLC